MEIFLIIFFIILVFIGGFCLWVIAKMGSLATDMEEQMEIERKLRKKGIKGNRKKVIYIGKDYE